VQEEEDLGGVRVAFCEGDEVEVAVADVEILQALVNFRLLPPKGASLL
jgi:hypothetical protein